MINQICKHFICLKSASTGTAANNIKGCTIDSLLKLQQDITKLLIYDKMTHKHMLYNDCFEKCDYIIIDEIAMIDGKKLDEIYKRVRYINKHKISNKIITKLFICGDCLQLPSIDSKTGSFLIVVNLNILKNINIHVNYQR